MVPQRYVHQGEGGGSLGIGILIVARTLSWDFPDHLSSDVDLVHAPVFFQSFSHDFIRKKRIGAELVASLGQCRNQWQRKHREFGTQAPGKFAPGRAQGRTFLRQQIAMGGSPMLSRSSTSVREFML